FFEEARYQAAAISYGALALRHYHLMNGLGLVERSRVPRHWFLEAGELGTPYDGQLKAALDYTASLKYGANLTLSQRLWKLDDASVRGIQQTVQGGIA